MEKKKEKKNEKKKSVWDLICFTLNCGKYLILDFLDQFEDCMNT